MKIVEQTATRMVLRQKPQGILFVVVWSSLFSGIPLAIIISLMSKAGVTSVLCQRVQPTQVACEVSQSQFFGLVSNGRTTLQSVSAAELDAQTYTNEDGDYQVYRAVLVGPQGSINAINYSSDYLMAQDVVTQVNQMLHTQQPRLQLTYDTRWNLNETIVPILFLSMFVTAGLGLLYGVVRTRTLILDKVLNRLTYKTWTLLGTRRLDLPLGVVTEVKLKQHTDSYGNKYYEPILVPDAVRRIALSNISNRQQALEMQEQVRQFLQLPAAEPLAPEPDAFPTVYSNQTRIYQTTNLTEVPRTAGDIQALDQQLLRLGFTFVGDLMLSDFPGLTLYTYAQPSKAIYAGIISIGDSDAPMVSLDFCSSFLNGVVAITTSSRLIIRHLKPQKLMRWSYPDLEVVQLYQKHQQHILELQEQAGQPQRVKADLATVAAVADDCFVRQTRGWVPLVALLINLSAAGSHRTRLNSIRGEKRIR